MYRQSLDGARNRCYPNRMKFHTFISIAALALLACGGKQNPPPTDEPAEQISANPLIAACDAGTANSCLIAANDAEQAGRMDEAATLYERGCKLGASEGCALAGGLHGEAGALDKASASFEAGCALEDATSCYGRGLIAGGSFGGDGDLAQTVTWFEKACTLGLAAACGDLSTFYRVGEGGLEVDLEKAAALQKQACEGGDGESCTRLGLEAWKAGDAAAASSYFEKSCGTELPDPAGCGYHGWRLWTGPDDAEHARGIALMDASCEAGSAIGCSLRANSHARLGDVDQGQELLQKACELDAAQCEVMTAQFEQAQKPDSSKP